VSARKVTVEDKGRTVTVVEDVIKVRLSAGQRGPTGPVLDHEWDGTALALQNPDQTWDDPVDLKGDKGDTGHKGDTGTIVAVQHEPPDNPVAGTLWVQTNS
jgi:hypothetical protein